MRARPARRNMAVTPGLARFPWDAWHCRPSRVQRPCRRTQRDGRGDEIHARDAVRHCAPSSGRRTRRERCSDAGSAAGLPRRGRTCSPPPAGRTRLDDFGDESFREPLRMVLQGLEDEARLTLDRPYRRPAGRARPPPDAPATRRRTARRHPEIGAERRAAAALHRGPAADGQHPAPSSARPGSGAAGSPRRGKSWPRRRRPRRRPTRPIPGSRSAARQLAWFDALAPEFKTIHPLGAQLALECIAIMSPSFLSSRFHTTYRVPTYQAWLEGQDLGPAYRFHRRLLQQLQWRMPARPVGPEGARPISSPSTRCFETYPDARIVQTHRDPLTVLASVASLTAILQGAFSRTSSTSARSATR